MQVDRINNRTGFLTTTIPQNKQLLKNLSDLLGDGG